MGIIYIGDELKHSTPSGVRFYTGEDLKWDTPSGCHFKSLPIPLPWRIKNVPF